MNSLSESGPSKKALKKQQKEAEKAARKMEEKQKVQCQFNLIISII